MRHCTRIQKFLARVVETSSAGLLVLALHTAAPVHAGDPGEQVYLEDFEDMGFVPIGGWGPQGLIDEGWVFENNSEPLGTQAWFAGCCWGALIQPLSGTGYLAASQDSAAGSSPQYSAWAILPVIAGQQAGDIFTFYTISSDTSPFDNVSLEVRYSPTGGIDVGTSADDVGDFTDALLDITTMPNYNTGIANGWTYWELTLPGPGRIALRQYGDSSLYFGVEDVMISHPAPPSGPLPEDFENLGGVCGEGPCALVENGWLFVDQSTPSTYPAWEPNIAGDPLEAHEGFGFIKSVSVAGGSFQSGGVNNWAILPDVLTTGDQLDFFVTGALGDGGVLELRYSPTGGTSTGSGVNGTGDFSQVLLSLSNIPYGPWQLVSATIPGDGRVAIRFHNPFIPGFSGSKTAAVDTVTVNTTPAGPPLPGPGETVTWTVDISPITIDFNVSIPPGGTVIIDPGVVINITTGNAMTIAGELYANGEADNPIAINGWAPAFDAVLAVPGGHSEFTHVVMNDGRFEPTFATNCTITSSILDARLVAGCSFVDSNSVVQDGNLAVVDSTFDQGSISVLRGYLHIDNVSIDDGTLFLSREDASHTVYLNNLSIANRTDGAAIDLSGWSVFLDENVTLTNNLYPITLAGGIEPGSTLSPTGNINNVARLANTQSPTGRDELPPLPVPYYIAETYDPGISLEVLPGVQFLAAPGAHFWSTFHPTRLMGLPDQPITFAGQSASPGSWLGIQWSLTSGSKAEWCIVRHAERAMLVDEDVIQIDNCLFENNIHGSRTSNFGISYLRKNQFVNNSVGISATPNGSFDAFGQANPNSIAGNAQGAIEEDPGDSPDARYNWWGDPSGPTTPDNPGGQGDSASANVNVIPFLTAEPDFDDHPPVVRLAEMSAVFETGSPLLLHWEAFDDSAIASQRVLFTETGALSSAVVLLDNLPPSQRSAIVSVPESTFFHHGNFILQAFDDAGQIGNDLRFGSIMPDPETIPGEFTFPPGLEGPFVTGEDVAFEVDLGFTYAVELGDMNEDISLGAGVLGMTAPYLSTDTARLVAVSGVATGKRFYSDYFTVRPPSYIGDEAPQIALLSPTAGSFGGGSTLNIAWTASDDEAIRSFDVQASLDGGRTWTIVRKRLPAEATGFAWTLPPSNDTLSDVRLRVIAYDKRFQSASATTTIAITPGSGGPIIGDLDNDGVVGPADLAQLLASWGSCPAKGECIADISPSGGDGTVGPADLAALLANWG